VLASPYASAPLATDEEDVEEDLEASARIIPATEPQTGEAASTPAVIGSFVPNTFVNTGPADGAATQSTMNGTPAMSMGAVIEAHAAERDGAMDDVRGIEEEYGDDEIEETARPVGWSLNMARSAAMRTRERRSVGPGGGLNPDDVEKPPTQSMTSNVAETPGDLPDPLHAVRALRTDWTGESVQRRAGRGGSIAGSQRVLRVPAGRVPGGLGGGLVGRG
jgi:hypothetical protein